MTRYPGYQLLVTADDIDAGRFAELASEGRKALSVGESHGRLTCSIRLSLVAWEPGAG